jgi:hypothetical protein
MDHDIDFTADLNAQDDGVSMLLPLIATTVGPAEITAGRAYVHDIELDGDENLAIGTRVEVQDTSGRLFDAAVTRRVGARWQVPLKP